MGTYKMKPGEQAAYNRYMKTQSLLGQPLNADEKRAVHQLLWEHGFKVYVEDDIFYVRPGFDLNEHPLWLMHERSRQDPEF
jgi:hypothetical protein